MIEIGTKGKQHPKKSFGRSFKNPREILLKTKKSEETLYKRVQAMLKNKDERILKLVETVQTLFLP